jgi:outer membrane receptor protein involved in Fe transport
LAPVFGFPPYVIATNPLSNNKFSQELRASASVGATLDVLAGLFYTHEKTLPSASIYGVNPYTAAPTTPVNGFSLNDPSTLDEYAAFTDLTYHFTSQLDVQLGVRADHIDQVFPAFFTYSPVPPSPSVTPRTWAHATPVTYLLTPQYFITPDLMLYARAASGYRPGGSNTTPGVPPQFDPDKTYTYEAGTKDSFLGSRLTADLSVYYVAWKDIQTQTQANGNGFPFTGNGGGAKSQGVELTVTAKPFRATTVSGWVDYDDAVLTKALPSAAGYGLAGDRLPLSTKYSGNVSIRQDLPAFSGVAPFASIDASYTGNRVGIFQPTALRQEYGGYTQTNIVAGINYQAWLVNGYVNNVTDSRGELNGGLGYGFNNPLLFLFIQPRTVGLSFTRKF